MSQLTEIMGLLGAFGDTPGATSERAFFPYELGKDNRGPRSLNRNYRKKGPGHCAVQGDTSRRRLAARRSLHWWSTL